MHRMFYSLKIVTRKNQDPEPSEDSGSSVTSHREVRELKSES